MNTDLVPLGDVEDVLVQEGLSVERARLAIEAIPDLAGARDVVNQASAAHHYYARARETRGLARKATEIQVWAERRAGEILMEDGASYDDVASRAKDLGTSPRTLKRWVSFARADEKRLAEVIGEIAGTDRELTVTGVAQRLLAKGLRRVERGIYINHLGRFVLRWRKDGVTRQKMVEGELGQAHHHLLEVTGALSADSKPVRREHPAKRNLEDAYASVRFALSACDRALPLVDSEKRTELRAVMADLYRAEDRLGPLLKR